MPKYIIEIETDIPFTRSSVKDAVRALLPHPMTKPSSEGWISVQDRLPELHKRVLVITEKQIQFNRLVINGPDVKGKHCIMWAGGDKVTHWMPLPAAPEDK